MRVREYKDDGTAPPPRPTGEGAGGGGVPQVTLEELQSMNPDVRRAFQCAQDMMADREPNADDQDVAFRSSVKDAIQEQRRRPGEHGLAGVRNGIGSERGSEAAAVLGRAEDLARKRAEGVSGDSNQGNWIELLDPELRERALQLLMRVQQITQSQVRVPPTLIFDEGEIARNYGFVKNPQTYDQALYTLMYVSFTEEEFRRMAARETNIARKQAYLQSAQHAHDSPTHRALDNDTTLLTNYLRRSFTISNYVMLMDVREMWLAGRLPKEYEKLPLLIYKNIDVRTRAVNLALLTPRAATRNIDAVCTIEARLHEHLQQQLIARAQANLDRITGELKNMYDRVMEQSGREGFQLGALDVGSRLGGSRVTAEMGEVGQLTTLYQVGQDGSITVDTESQPTMVSVRDAFTSQAVNEHDNYDSSIDMRNKRDGRKMLPRMKAPSIRS